MTEENKEIEAANTVDNKKRCRIKTAPAIYFLCINTIHSAAAA